MALVTCPDCSKSHSDAAPACPECGRPNARAAQARPVVIEKTSKKWKRLMFWGVALIPIGGFACMTGGAASLGGGSSALATFGKVTMLAGLLLYSYARIGAWREHG